MGGCGVSIVIFHYSTNRPFFPVIRQRKYAGQPEEAAEKHKNTAFGDGAAAVRLLLGVRLQRAVIIACRCAAVHQQGRAGDESAAVAHQQLGRVGNLIRRAMARPICPAPAHSITFFIPCSPTACGRFAPMRSAPPPAFPAGRRPVRQTGPAARRQTPRRGRLFSYR